MQIRPPPSTLSKNSLGGGPRNQCPRGLAPAIPFQGEEPARACSPTLRPLSAPGSLTIPLLAVFGQSSLGLGSWDWQGEGLGQEEGSGGLACEKMELGPSFRSGTSLAVAALRLQGSCTWTEEASKTTSSPSKARSMGPEFSNYFQSCGPYEVHQSKTGGVQSLTHSVLSLFPPQVYPKALRLL